MKGQSIEMLLYLLPLCHSSLQGCSSHRDSDIDSQMMLIHRDFSSEAKSTTESMPEHLSRPQDQPIRAYIPAISLLMRLIRKKAYQATNRIPHRHHRPRDLPNASSPPLPPFSGPSVVPPGDKACNKKSAGTISLTPRPHHTQRPSTYPTTPRPPHSHPHSTANGSAPTSTSASSSHHIY